MYVGGERVAAAPLEAPLAKEKKSTKLAAGTHLLLLPRVHSALALRISEVRVWGSRRDERDIEDMYEEPLEIASLEFEGDGYSARAALFSAARGGGGSGDSGGLGLKKKKKKKKKTAALHAGGGDGGLSRRKVGLPKPGARSKPRALGAPRK